MRGFFAPPEARDLNDQGSRTWTPEAVTLGSLLLVTLPVTAGFSFMFAPVLLPSTALVAYAFWRLGHLVTKPGAMIAYCFAAGTFAGVLNSWLTLLFWSLFSRGGMYSRVDAATFSVGTLLGAAVGLAYGTAYLLPMLVKLSARSLRRTEGVDRCLISFGLWGMLVLCLGLAGAYAYYHPIENTLEVVLVVTLASVGIHACMLAFGLIRWARRKSWLARVARGKVPGWLVCEQAQFQQHAIGNLEVFCKPWFGPTDTSGLRVLARGSATRSTEAYRTSPPEPRFLVV